MQTIHIRGIHIYAHHGCLPEEAIVGGDYVINISLKGDFTKAGENDKLEDTADYVMVFQIVKREMAIRSNLVEHVSKRIHTHLKTSFPNVETISVEVIKKNPPIGGEVDEVSVVEEG